MFIFIYFPIFRRFNLIDPKETEVLRDLEIALRLTDDQLNNSTNSNSTTVKDVEHVSLAATTNSSSTTNIDNSNLIDGDSTAQPICKQPLESGNVNNNINSLNNQQIQNNCPGSGGGGGGGGGINSGTGSTGSIGVIGCGVGYSTANSTQQSTTNTQTA